MDHQPAKKAPRKARRISADYLHNAALYYLERYAASEGRMRQILEQKVHRACRDHPDHVLADLLPLVEKEIETLRRVSLIDDDRLIAQFIEGYTARGMPTRMIAQKLRTRGFTPAVITAYLSKIEDKEGAAEMEQAAAVSYLERRHLWPYTKTPIEDPALRAKARQKAWAALARRGHDPDLIIQAMKLPT